MDTLRTLEWLRNQLLAKQSGHSSPTTLETKKDMLTTPVCVHGRTSEQKVSWRRRDPDFGTRDSHMSRSTTPGERGCNDKMVVNWLCAQIQKQLHRWTILQHSRTFAITNIVCKVNSEAIGTLRVIYYMPCYFRCRRCYSEPDVRRLRWPGTPHDTEQDDMY